MSKRYVWNIIKLLLLQLLVFLLWSNMPNIHFLFLHSFHFPKAGYFILTFTFSILLNLLGMKYLHMLLHFKCIYSFILTCGWMHIWRVLESSIFILYWHSRGVTANINLANLVVNLGIQSSITILPSVLWTAASLQALIYPENSRKIWALIMCKNLKSLAMLAIVCHWVFFKSLTWLTWCSAEILPKLGQGHLVLTVIFFKV